MLRIEPVDGFALVGPDLLQITSRAELDERGGGLISEAPDGVHVVRAPARTRRVFTGTTSRRSSNACTRIAGKTSKLSASYITG